MCAKPTHHAVVIFFLDHPISVPRDLIANIVPNSRLPPPLLFLASLIRFLAGSATCSNGIPGIEGMNANGIGCCDTACGSCGGLGCHGFPGGSQKCCIDPILASGRACDAEGAVAPCVVSKF